MKQAIQKARQAARAVIEQCHYDGVANVTEYREVNDEITGLTSDKEVVVLENQPCHLSIETINAASQSISAASVAQVAKLFISPDITIRAGSKITVTQAGVTTDYTYSGIPAVYDTHQEIVLELFERYT